jgi:hypothetical protein
VSETKFTPGPWRASVEEPAVTADFRHHDALYAGYVNRDTASRTQIARTPASHDREVALANAHLIASAPDLYAALEACEQRLADLLRSDYSTTSNPAPQDEDDAVRAARAALAKARGE